MSFEQDKRIKFPEKHYVGFQKRKDYVNLGFMTPHGTDSAAKKRMETVDRWAKGNDQVWDSALGKYVANEESIPSVVYENGPLTGFFLSNAVNHSSSWNSCRDKWRIEDPRGFELEITSGNLEKIMETCSIVKGVIQEECIWARMDAENILVPTNCSVYDNAKNNTARYGSTVPIKNGDVFWYVGRFYLITAEGSYMSNEAPEVIRFSVTDKQYYVFEETQNLGWRGGPRGHYRAIAQPKVARVVDGQSISHLLKDGAEKYVNSKFENMSTHVGYGHVGVCSEKIDPESYVFETIENVTFKDAEKLGFKYGFVNGEEGTLNCFYARESHGWQAKEGTMDCDPVHNDHHFTFYHAPERLNNWSSYYSRRRRKMPLVNTFAVVKAVFDTGQSKVIYKI